MLMGRIPLSRLRAQAVKIVCDAGGLWFLRVVVRE